MAVLAGESFCFASSRIVSFKKAVGEGFHSRSMWRSYVGFANNMPQRNEIGLMPWCAESGSRA